MLSQELRKTHPSQPKRDFRKSQPMRPDFSLRAEVQGSGLQPLGLDGCLHTTRFHFETAGTQPEPDPLATKPPAVEVGSTRGHFSAVRVQLQTELHCATVPCSGTEQASLSQQQLPAPGTRVTHEIQHPCSGKELPTLRGLADFRKHCRAFFWHA